MCEISHDSCDFSRLPGANLLYIADIYWLIHLHTYCLGFIYVAEKWRLSLPELEEKSMFNTANRRDRWLRAVLSCSAVILAVLLVGGVTSASGQIRKVSTTAGPTAAEAPFTGYKGVQIGMQMTDARAKLGKAKDTSDVEDYFVFSDAESAQVLYDTDKTVKVISVNYVGPAAAAPTPKAIFGEDAEVKPDGSIYKMVKYPKAGYWICYNKTAGDDPLVMITVQKMVPGQ
jgi:hypothetical protein